MALVPDDLTLKWDWISAAMKTAVRGSEWPLRRKAALLAIELTDKTVEATAPSSRFFQGMAQRTMNRVRAGDYCASCGEFLFQTLRLCGNCHAPNPLFRDV